MIKLTVLQYKLKVPSLEKYHNISEHNQGLLFAWEVGQERAKNFDTEYPKKPFIEPFEFENSDYNIENKKFRIRLEDIRFYKENAENIVVIYVGEEEAYTIKETIEELDALFGI